MSTTFASSTSARTEVIAGITTFITMAYIIVVNPAILSTEGTGMPFSGVLTATVLLAFSMTLMMGLYAKLPYAVAPGMGINAFFTFTVILGKQVPWPVALGLVFWAGVLFVIKKPAGFSCERWRDHGRGLGNGSGQSPRDFREHARFLKRALQARYHGRA